MSLVSEVQTWLKTHLIFQSPVVDCQRLQAKPREGILAADDETDQHKLRITEDLRNKLLHCARGEVISLDLQVGILLVQNVGKLFVHFAVSS